MPLDQNPQQTVTRFGCIGFSMYVCGFSVPKMRQFCLFTYPPRSKWVSSFLNHSEMLSFHRCFQFWEEEKVSGVQVRWIRWLRHDYGLVFDQKLTHKHRCVSWCFVMVQNPGLVFCAFLTNCFAQSYYYWPYDLVARIHDTPRHCNRRKQRSKPSHLTELDVRISVFALLDASIGTIGLWFQSHSLTAMNRHQLWNF